ncbi:MAG: nitroreductase family protein, partial [Acidimicrobiia bacterium]
AIRSPSGGNAQSWRFIAVTDPELKRRLGGLYWEAWETIQTRVHPGRRERAQAAGDDQALRVLDSAEWLARNFVEVPLWILAFSRNDPTGASIFPAVWSLMLAARAQGLGTTLTTILGEWKQAEVAELLGVPPDRGWVNSAAVSVGYPNGRWAVAARRPAHEVAFAERWGEPVSWRADEPLFTHQER